MRRAAGALLVWAAMVAGCGDDDGDPQVLRLSVETEPGAVRYDKDRLSASAGRMVFELTNDRPKGHNLRIHTGDRCCFRRGSMDIGGTPTISEGSARVVLDLEPGTYTYLCSTGGYWRTQHGTLVVR